MTRTQRELLSILAELEDGSEYTWNIARARDPEGWDALASRGLFRETDAKQRKARAVRQVLARLEGLVTLDGYDRWTITAEGRSRLRGDKPRATLAR